MKQNNIIIKNTVTDNMESKGTMIKTNIKSINSDKVNNE